MKQLLSQDEIDTLLRGCLTAGSEQVTEDIIDADTNGSTAKDIGPHGARTNCTKNKSSKKRRRKSSAHSLDMLLEKYKKGVNYDNEPADVFWPVEYCDSADCPGCGEDINLLKLNGNRCPLCGQLIHIDYYFT